MEKGTHQAALCRSGFTLIELSIVLLIIGLIVGGIMVGRDLIESSKIRAQVTQLGRYSTAVNAFKLKYNYLPGDIPIPESRAAGLPRDSGVTNSVNGDGTYTFVDPDGLVNGRLDSFETIYFFPQLGFTHMIEGVYKKPCWNYDGTYVNSGADACSRPVTLGLDFPAMKLNERFGIQPVTIPAFGGNWFALGIKAGVMGWLSSANSGLKPSLTPLQAYSLDSKIDDGVPSGGMVRAVKIVSDYVGGIYDNRLFNDNLPASNCVTSSAATAYKITNGNVNCKIVVKMQ